MARRFLKFPTPEDLIVKYQLLTTEELEKLVLVMVDNKPADTGAPRGQKRYYHCKGRTKKCELCKAWLRWETEFELLSRELQRRRRLQWGGVMKTYIVKWHAVVTIGNQSKAFSGVEEVEAENQLEAIAQVQGNIYCAKPDPIELNIDEVMESA